MAKYNRNSLRPVLSLNNDDYVDDSFKLKAQVIAEQDGYVITINLNLDNDDLVGLIKKGKAKFLVRFYCPYTNMRDRVITSENSLGINFGLTKLLGDVYISAFLIAVCDIEGFRSEAFHPDYGDKVFNYKKGQLLAESDVAVFSASSSKTIISEKYSLITVVKSADIDDGKTNIFIENDSIIVEMTDESVDKLKRINQQTQNKAVLYSLVVVPALCKAISAIKEKGIHEYDNYKWFMIVKNKLCEYIAIKDDEFDFGQYDPWSLAQQLIGNPLGQALDDLCVLNGGEVES